MKIVLVGPGAMGCLWAGILAEAGQDVWLLDRRRPRVRELAEKGIRIDDESGTRALSVQITTDGAEAGTADLVVICVKAYDTVEAIHKAMPAIGPDTAVLSIQNGIGNAEKLAEGVDVCQILGGSTLYGATCLGYGHVRHAGTGPTHIAPFGHRGIGAALRVAEGLTSCGIETSVIGELESLMWSKLVVSAAINPVTAISDLSNGDAWAKEDLRELMSNASREVVALAREKCIPLLFKDPVAEVERVCRLTAANISSMLQDVRRNKRTEIDFITGAIAGEAHARGVKTPCNEMLYEKVRDLERRKYKT